MRWIGLITLAFLLNGCALPVAVSVASMAADAGSYMLSGKTLKDHGLSLAMDQDCAVTRVLEDGEVCEEAPEYEVAVAALMPLPEGSELDLALASGPEAGATEPAVEFATESATEPTVALALPSEPAVEEGEPAPRFGARKETLVAAIPLTLEQDGLVGTFSFAPEAESQPPLPPSPSWTPPQGKDRAARLDDDVPSDYMAAEVMTPGL